MVATWIPSQVTYASLPLDSDAAYRFLRSIVGSSIGSSQRALIQVDQYCVDRCVCLPSAAHSHWGKHEIYNEANSFFYSLAQMGMIRHGLDPAGSSPRLAINEGRTGSITMPPTIVASKATNRDSSS